MCILAASTDTSAHNNTWKAMSVVAWSSSVKPQARPQPRHDDTQLFHSTERTNNISDEPSWYTVPE